MKKKNIILLIIAIVMFILVGSTMAYFGWSSSAENKDQLVDVTVSSGTGSCDKLSDNNKLLYPTSTREKGRILKVTTKQQMATNAFVTWNLVVNSINETTLTTSGLKHKSFKYELVNDTTGVSYGTGSFENVTNGTTITFSTDKETLDYNKEYIFILYLWIDGTIGNNPLDMTNQPYNFDLNCNITGTDKKINKITTPLDNFTYFLGSDTSTVDTINYYNPDDGEYYNVTIPTIELASDEILLVKYNGNSKNILVPDTYIIGGNTYKVTVLSLAYNESFENIRVMDGIFLNNTNIERVQLGNNIKSIYTFNENLVENSMHYMFYDCTSLTSANIPNTVTKLGMTFSGCTSLVNAPEIPSSVTSIAGTFLDCTSLVNVPEIPSSVTSMNGTFVGCTSLVNAPEIPSSVTNMSSTFNDCTNLTGIVKINSSNVTDATGIFTNTTKSITVQVPSGSTTYTKINALTTTNGKPSNVTLTTY